MRPVLLTRKACPSWFLVKNVQETDFDGTATISTEGAAADQLIDLRIWEDVGQVFVSELVPGTVYPKDCPELHINSDGSFCIALAAQDMVVDLQAAQMWWMLLEDHLKVKRSAERTGVWPTRKALSHGDAGKYQLEALRAAKELNIVEDYYRMLDGESVWFCSKAIRLDHTGTTLTNGRAPCPMGCTRKHGKFRIQRRKCHHTKSIVKLVIAEQKRREEEEKFWQERTNRTCCGRMKGCPLTSLTERKASPESGFVSCFAAK